ncbi:MAG: hypothetical protein ACP5P4_13760 [Steroidobacteraceae bacterium]
MRIAPGPHSAAWQALGGHARRLAEVPTRELFGRPVGAPLEQRLATWRDGGSSPEFQERNT